MLGERNLKPSNLVRIVGALSISVAALGAALPAIAAPIDKTLTIKVIQVCNDAGANCASLGPSGNNYFASEVNKIWAQAGISIDFDFFGQINSTALSYNADFNSLTAAGNNYQSTSVVEMFLTHTFNDGSYGIGWLGVGGFGIAMDDVMAYNGGIGRIDTIAHELGHNLGLDHVNVANRLLAPGYLRNVPTTIADITPDGLGLDIVSADEIAVVRSSSLLRNLPTTSAAPEPAVWALMILGFGAVGGRMRRRARLAV